MSTKAIMTVVGIAAVGSLGLYLYLRKKKTAKATAAVLTGSTLAPLAPVVSTTPPATTATPQAALSPEQLAAIVEQQERAHYCTYSMGSPFLDWSSQLDTKIGIVQKKFGIPPQNMFPLSSGFASGTSFSITPMGLSVYERVNELNVEYGCPS